MARGNKLTENLHSKEPSKVLKAIDALRHSGCGKDIPEIIELLHRTKSEEVKEAVAGLLKDLKDKEGVPYIMEAIRNRKYKNELEIIVGSCWQSGLDYSQYIRDFISLVIRENYVVALEAMTVVENLSCPLPVKDSEEYIGQLKSAINSKDREKNFLYLEMVKILESIPTL